ncbi:integral membrane protein [Lophiotrema nucula]|uniref:Integral membrane protein n=1 Tax=Lophiotrema nucula TaxID=690887 RepID=A0A6A5ZIS9_9PLEO|nr:integral membrane protein [Lophiotrema nucula]
MATNVSCELKGDASVIVDNDLKISFHRTVRVPDNQQVSFLPPDLGAFPLKPVSQFAHKLPPDMAGKGGLFLPMFQSEAMWIDFSCSYNKAYMIKVYVGGVNAISGEPAVETAATKLRRMQKLYARGIAPKADKASPLQDYMVVPKQPWLDGIADSNGTVRQFVAMPLGSGYSVESQITGMDSMGGLQLEVTPVKAPPIGPRSSVRGVPLKYFKVQVQTLTGKAIIIPTCTHDHIEDLKTKVQDAEGIPLDQQRLIFNGQQLEDHRLLVEYRIGEMSKLHIVLRLRGGGGPVHQMNVAAGGKIKQVIEPDNDPSRWEGSKTVIFNVQILNSALYHTVTGSFPPAMPLTAKTYKQYGLPFFKLYEEPSGISGDFSLVKSVAQIDGVKNEEVKPKVKAISKKRDRDGNLAASKSAGITNAKGMLREFRNLTDLEKEFENYQVAGF